MNPIHVICFLLICPYIVLLPSARAARKCRRSFNCGNLGPILFPFTISEHSECGVLAIHGCNDVDPGAIKNIKIQNNWFRVVRIVQNPPTITIQDDQFNNTLVSSSCGAFSQNYTDSVPSSPFASFRIQYSLPLFTCPHNRSLNFKTHYTYIKYVVCQNVSDIYYFDGVVYPMPEACEDCQSFAEAGCDVVWLPFNEQLFSSNPEDPYKFVSAEVPIEIGLSPNCSSCYYDKEGQCRLESREIFYCHRDKTVKIVYIVAAGKH